MVPVINPLSAIVYGARGGDVETTIIDERAVMLNRRMQTVNEAQVSEAVGQAVPPLLKRSRLEGQAHILPKWGCSHVH